MRSAWLILLCVVLRVTALAQDQPSSAGLVIRDFSITDSPCGYKHDSAVEKALQTVRVVVDAAKPSRTGRVAMLELRNNSPKTVTAYVLNYTFTHAGKTDYYDGHGTDLVYKMAISRGGHDQALRNSSFPPGGVMREEIHGRGGDGEFAVYPCMVAFDDGTFIGPHLLWEFLMQMRANNAKAFAALIVDLKSAGDSANPKTFLTNRAKQIKRVTNGRSDQKPYHYLEIVASGLSPSGNSPLDRKAISDHVSALQAQQEMLLKQSTFRKTE